MCSGQWKVCCGTGCGISVPVLFNNFVRDILTISHILFTVPLTLHPARETTE